MAGKGSRTLLLSLVADTNQFDKKTKKSASRFQQWGKAISAAAAGAALAIAGFAAKWLGDGVQAAIAAEKIERRFARTLRNTTKATDRQVAAVEDYIEATQMATGVNDDELRASLERLVVATGKVTKAQKLQKLALDISAGTGKSLEQVTMALVKAQNGQLTSLRRLGVPLSDTILKAKDSDKAFKVLAKTFEGQAAQAADTTAGKLARLNERLGEIQEAAGAVLLDGLEPLTDWAVSPQGAEALDEIGRDINETLGNIVRQWQTVVDLNDITVDGGGLEPLLKNLERLNTLLTNAFKAFDAILKNPVFKTIYGATPGGILTDLLDRLAPEAPGGRYLRPGENPYGTRGGVTVNVNGATDPVATAKAVQKSLAEASRMGGYGWMGKGTG